MRESSFALAWRRRFYVAAIINAVVLGDRLLLSLSSMSPSSLLSDARLEGRAESWRLYA